MATFDFTGANGSALPSGLTARSGTFQINSNMLAPTGSAPSLPTWVVTGEGAKDGSTGANLFYADFSAVAGAVVRLNPADLSHIFIRLRYDSSSSNQGVYIYTYNGSGYTEVSSKQCATTLNSRLDVEFSGQTLTISVDGTLQHTYSTSFNQSHIHHGIRFNQNTQRADNLSIEGDSGTPIVTNSIEVGEAEYTNIVYQRDTNNVAAVSFPIAFEGSPTSLRYRLLNAGNASVIQDWAVFDNSPSGGTSTLSFDAPAAVIGYRVEVDFSNDATVKDAQTVVWRVGDNILIAGQSLAEDFDTDGNISSLTGFYKFNGVQGVQPSTGVGAYTIAKTIIDTQGVSVMFVNTADGGTPLTQQAGDADWWNRASGGTLWPNTVSLVNAMTAGQNRLAFVWWHQGTRDSLANISKSVYETQLGEFFTRMRTAFAGFDGLPLKIISALLGRDTRGTATDASHQAIRDAQISYAESDTNLHPINAYQSANEDGVHATDQAYIYLAEQITLKWLAVKGDVVASPMRLLSVSQGDSANEIDLTFTRPINAVDSAFDTEGVRVTDDTGDLTVQSFTRKSGATATITTQETPTGTVSVWFCYGAGATLNQLVYPKSESVSLPNGAGDFFYVAEAFSNEQLSVVIPNQPPTANAGPDQSVAAAMQFTLDGTGSQDTDGTIVEWRWTQTAGDTVTLDLENPAQPTATSPSKTTAQRLTFQLVTVDDENAVSSPSLVNIDVAAVVQNDVLNIIDKISFTFESDGMITAFPGRANRETFRLKPSDPTGLVLEDGWFDFEANDVRRVEISMLETTGVKIISSDTDSITRERSKLHVRMGDMPIKSSTKEFEPTVSVFVGDDERGVVMTAPGLSGAPKVKYYSTTARAV